MQMYNIKKERKKIVMSFKKNSLLLVVLGLLLLSIAVESSRKWADPGCRVFSPDGYRCLCCSHRWFMNDNGCCQQVSDLCRDWNKDTGCCTCCYEGYKLVNGQCCLAQAPVNKWGLKGSYVQQPHEYQPSFNQPSFGKQYVGGSQPPSKSNTHNSKPTGGVSGGWSNKPQYQKPAPQWNGKVGSGNDSPKSKPSLPGGWGQKPQVEKQAPQYVPTNVIKAENSGKIDVTGNGKDAFVNGLNGGSGVQLNNNVSKTLSTTDSGWVNKQNSQNKVITKIKVNLGNINKGVNLGNMDNKILVNLGNTAEINNGQSPDSTDSKLTPQQRLQQLQDIIPNLSSPSLASNLAPSLTEKTVAPAALAPAPAETATDTPTKKAKAMKMDLSQLMTLLNAQALAQKQGSQTPAGSAQP